MARRHDIPTHLGVQDRAIFGLSMRQTMLAVAGLAASYGMWNHLPHLPLAPRVALVAASVLLTAALTFVRPAGRGLEEWCCILVRYVSIPRMSVWRPRTPDAAAWRPTSSGWTEIAHQVDWSERGTQVEDQP